MTMTGYQTRKRPMKSEINVVPYIDVMLVLLVIFMATSPYITQGVDVELPKTSTSKSATEMFESNDVSFIIVQIDKEGLIGLSVEDQDFEHGLSLEEATVKIKAQLRLTPQSPVAVGGDINTRYADIIALLDQLNQAGITKVGLLTDTQTTKSTDR